MKRTMTLVALLAMTIPANAQSAPERWNGSYLYEHDGGRTVGGSGIVVRYSLMLTEQSCHLKVSGFQTDETIVCRARRWPNSVDIQFRSYADGATSNKYGVFIYRIGEPLVTLSKSGGTLTTQWHRYSPEDENPPAGRYFRRVAPAQASNRK